MPNFELFSVLPHAVHRHVTPVKCSPFQSLDSSIAEMERLDRERHLVRRDASAEKSVSCKEEKISPPQSFDGNSTKNQKGESKFAASFTGKDQFLD